MQKLRFVNGNGNEIDLTDGVKYGVVDWVGFSECGNGIQTQTVTFADGSVFLDTLLSERELSVIIAVQDGGNLERRYELKRELIKEFNPKLGEGYLYYQNDFLEKRIKVVPYLPVFPTKNSDTGGTLKADVSFTACDPYWEDVEETDVISVIEDDLNVLAVSASDGDVDISPTIIISSENNSQNNVFKRYKRIGDSYIIDSDISYPQSGSFTRIRAETGKKSIENLQFIKELENSFYRMSCVMWDRIYYKNGAGNNVRYTEDGFKTYSEIKNTFIDGEPISMLSSKSNDCIFYFYYFNNKTIIYALDKNGNYNLAGEIVVPYGNFFAITENENKCFLVYVSNELQGYFRLHIAELKNKIIISYEYIDNVSNFDEDFVLSKLYENDRGECLFVFPQSTSSYASFENGQWTIHGGGVSLYHNYLFFNHSGVDYFYNDSDKKINRFVYNKIDNTISSFADEETVSTIPIKYMNNVLYSYSQLDGLVSLYANGNKIFEFEETKNIKTINIKRVKEDICLYGSVSNPRETFIFLTSVFENIINYIQKFDYNITLNGVKYESGTGFSVYYRNKFAGV